MCGAAEEFVDKTLSRNIGDTFLDMMIGGATGGLVGFENGKTGGRGFGTKLATSLYKDMTGITQKEEMIELTKQQAEDAKAAARADRENAQALNAANQLAASRSARSVRARGATAGSAGTRSSVSSLGGDERDFLGL